MLRLNQALSLKREDDLLRRLKNCVGQIQNKSKEGSFSTKKYSQNTISKQMNKENSPDCSFRSHKKVNPIDLQNSFTTSIRQDLRSSKKKSLKQNQKQPFLMGKTQNYLQEQQNYLSNKKPYLTERKSLIPLNQSNNLQNLRKNLFDFQQQQQKQRKCPRNITESTKKRILQRAQLIDQMQNIIPQVSNNNQSFQGLCQNRLFKERQIEKKEKLCDIDRFQIKEQNQLLTSIDDKKSKIDSKKYENYKKFSMENLIKQNDQRKMQKLQKLKKITEFNQEINNRIRKLVGNFQNYLTHRNYS